MDSQYDRPMLPAIEDSDPDDATADGEQDGVGDGALEARSAKSALMEIYHDNSKHNARQYQQLLADQTGLKVPWSTVGRWVNKLKSGKSIIEPVRRKGVRQGGKNKGAHETPLFVLDSIDDAFRNDKTLTAKKIRVVVKERTNYEVPVRTMYRKLQLLRNGKNIQVNKKGAPRGTRVISSKEAEMAIDMTKPRNQRKFPLPDFVPKRDSYRTSFRAVASELAKRRVELNNDWPYCSFDLMVAEGKVPPTVKQIILPDTLRKFMVNGTRTMMFGEAPAGPTVPRTRGVYANDEDSLIDRQCVVSILRHLRSHGVVIVNIDETTYRKGKGKVRVIAQRGSKPVWNERDSGAGMNTVAAITEQHGLVLASTCRHTRNNTHHEQFMHKLSKLCSRLYPNQLVCYYLDNCGIHTVALKDKSNGDNYFLTNREFILYNAAYSPDLAMIEMMFSQLKRVCSAVEVVNMKPEQRIAVIQAAFLSIDTQYVRNLYSHVFGEVFRRVDAMECL